MGVPVYVTCCSPLTAFNALSLSLIFAILVTSFPSVVLFGLILFGTLSWICFLSQVREVFIYHVFRYALYTYLSSSSGTPLMPMLVCLMSSVQFSSVAQSCPTLCDPMDCSMPGLPVHHQLLEFTQTHVHWVGDAIQTSHPLSCCLRGLLNCPHLNFFLKFFLVSFSDFHSSVLTVCWSIPLYHLTVDSF